MTRGCVALVVGMAALSPAMAAPQAPDTAVLPTMFAPVGKSMQQLIGEGWQVINIASGLTGFGYLLKRDTRYVTCAVQPDPSNPNEFRSECRAMN